MKSSFGTAFLDNFLGDHPRNTSLTHMHVRAHTQTYPIAGHGIFTNGIVHTHKHFPSSPYTSHGIFANGIVHF